MNPRIYADFNYTDVRGRLPLTRRGTLEDLARLGVELREGLRVMLYTDDADDEGNLDAMFVAGLVTRSQEDDCWVAVIDWDAIQHTSDIEKSNNNGHGQFSIVAPPTSAS